MALTVSDAHVAETKMSAAISQASGSAFRGLEQVDIIPFKITTDTPVQESDTREGKNLGLLPSALGSDIFGGKADGGHYLYGQVYIQSGINAALVYGRATKESVTIEDEDSLAFKQRNGVLHAPDLQSVTTPADINFSLEPYLNAYRKNALYVSWRSKLISYLNSIVKAGVTNKRVTPNVTYTFNAMDAYPYPEDLKAAFQEFVAYGAVTPGSKAALDPRLTELYKVVYSYSKEKRASADYHSGTYYYVYELANALVPIISNGNYVSLSGSGQWLSVSLLENGPEQFGLPAGAYALQYREGSRAFDIVLDNKDNNTNQRVGVFTTDERYFTYPPYLYYRSNGAVRTTEDESVSSYYASQSESWENILSHYTESEVTTRSKSAAICEPLQYAVARLDVQMEQCATYLLDNRDESIPMYTQNYPLTGILVAGQKNVDFNFSPISTSAQYVVYDADVSGAYLSSSQSSSLVPVLLLESEEETCVNFALEFVNNSYNTIYGINDCAIGRGMHFYLLGKLELPDERTVDGVTLNSVLTKDHVTKLTATVTSLKYAHSVLPDLREVQLSIGVDAVLDWDDTTPTTIEIK